MNAAQVRTLDAMGLTVWVPRVAGDQTQPSSNHEATCEPPGIEVYPGKDPVAVVFVVTPRDFRVTMKTDDGVMMARILEAMKARKGAFAVRHIKDTMLRSPVSLSQYVQVLVFGSVDGTAPDGWIIMPSLDAMVAEPHLKRSAWDQLKPLVGRIGVSG